ncbi:MAG: hypothetical protein OET79_08365, partial [Nitrospirota bacterium]|nr:hypothetical protein [Nitrospirota bacterium]
RAGARSSPSFLFITKLLISKKGFLFVVAIVGGGGSLYKYAGRLFFNLSRSLQGKKERSEMRRRGGDIRFAELFDEGGAVDVAGGGEF